MPEKAEVIVIVNKLNEIFTGSFWLETLVPKHPNTLKYCNSEDIEFLCKNEFKIGKFNHFGKYIILPLVQEESKKPEHCFIIIHLRMTGALIYSKEISEHKHCRASLILSDAEDILHHINFIDPRIFGKLYIIRNKPVKQWFAEQNLNTDILDSDSVHVWLESAKKKKQPIKDFLLDQKIVCGIGNYMASEILWDVGIHPEIPVNTISQEQFEHIHFAAKELISNMIGVGGVTIKDFTHPDGTAGNGLKYLKVYGKENCSRCENKKIQKLYINKRATYFCSNCQEEKENGATIK